MLAVGHGGDLTKHTKKNSPFARQCLGVCIFCFVFSFFNGTNDNRCNKTKRDKASGCAARLTAEPSALCALQAHRHSLVFLFCGTGSKKLNQNVSGFDLCVWLGNLKVISWRLEALVVLEELPFSQLLL